MKNYPLSRKRRLWLGVVFVAAALYVALFCGGCESGPELRMGRPPRGVSFRMTSNTPANAWMMSQATENTKGFTKENAAVAPLVEAQAGQEKVKAMSKATADVMNAIGIIFSKASPVYFAMVMSGQWAEVLKGAQQTVTREATYDDPEGLTDSITFSWKADANGEPEVKMNITRKGAKMPDNPGVGPEAKP